MLPTECYVFFAMQQLKVQHHMDATAVMLGELPCNHASCVSVSLEPVCLQQFTGCKDAYTPAQRQGNFTRHIYSKSLNKCWVSSVGHAAIATMDQLVQCWCMLNACQFRGAAKQGKPHLPWLMTMHTCCYDRASTNDCNVAQMIQWNCHSECHGSDCIWGGTDLSVWLTSSTTSAMSATPPAQVYLLLLFPRCSRIRLCVPTPGMGQVTTAVPFATLCDLSCLPPCVTYPVCYIVLPVVSATLYYLSCLLHCVTCRVCYIVVPLMFATLCYLSCLLHCGTCDVCYDIVLPVLFATLWYL